MKTYKFRRPRNKKLVGAKGVGAKIRHQEIVKAITRLSKGRDFDSCSPMDVWRECLRVYKINFDGEYYGSGNTPKPSRSQATMMSMRLSSAKENVLNMNGPAVIEAATRFLAMAKNEKAALDLIERCSQFIKLAGDKEKAKAAIKTVSEVKKAIRK